MANKNLTTAFYSHQWRTHKKTVNVDKSFLIPAINKAKYEDYIGSHLCVHECYSFICFLIAAILNQPWYILLASSVAGYLIGLVFLFIPEIFPLNFVTLLYGTIQQFFLPIVVPIIISIVYKNIMIIVMYIALSLLNILILSPLLTYITSKVSMSKYGLPYTPYDYKAFSEAKRTFSEHFRIALMEGGLPAFYKMYLEDEIEYDEENDL